MPRVCHVSATCTGSRARERCTHREERFARQVSCRVGAYLESRPLPNRPRQTHCCYPLPPPPSRHLGCVPCPRHRPPCVSRRRQCSAPPPAPAGRRPAQTQPSTRHHQAQSRSHAAEVPCARIRRPCHRQSQRHLRECCRQSSGGCPRDGFPSLSSSLAACALIQPAARGQQPPSSCRPWPAGMPAPPVFKTTRTCGWVSFLRVFYASLAKRSRRIGINLYVAQHTNDAVFVPCACLALARRG
eukprot:COSAG06_NODE_254_length_19039_cov_5.465488_8_plen_243_part_00